MDFQEGSRSWKDAAKQLPSSRLKHTHTHSQSERERERENWSPRTKDSVQVAGCMHVVSSVFTSSFAYFGSIFTFS